MASIESGLVYQVGTYNGNPLSMAAARASFEEVMTPEAYATSSISTTACTTDSPRSSTSTASRLT